MRHALIILVAALACAAAAQAAPQERIEVTASVASHNIARLPPAGRSGDAEYSRWIVRDRRGDAIGDILMDCRWVTVGLRLCVGQMAMPLGALAIVGASRTRFLGQLAVVGGTGLYEGADGTLLFKTVSVGRYVLSISYKRDGP